MVSSVYDLRAFYECKKGKIILPLLQQQIDTIWPDTKGDRIMGYGYAPPFLDRHRQESERVFSIMPSQMGVHAWLPGGKNLACLSSESDLPIETESIDRLLVIHGLEFSSNIHVTLQEFWRIMKSTGRILVMVPNRNSLWSRAEWSPFGHGHPYSASQMISVLRENLFVIERVEKCLFIPPFRSSFLLRSTLPAEKFGKRILGGMGGVVAVEASKQLYSGLLANNTSRLNLGTRKVWVPSAAPGG